MKKESTYRIINVLCATDDNYAPYCGVMLTSFLENHKAFHTEVYIVVKKRLKEEKRLKRLEERYDVKVNIVEFPFSDITSSFPIGNRHWTIEMYYRLFAPELLPKDIDRVLYLDCDIIVDGDVSEMYFSDINNISALVCPDFFMYVKHKGWATHLGYEEEKGYFNSGVMFINLDYWREHNIQESCLEYLKIHHDILFFYDQDVLNYVLRDTKKFVNLEYNFLSNLISKGVYNSFDTATKNEIISCHPRVIHFISPKPWSIFSYKYTYVSIWDKYCKMSQWRKPLFQKLPKEKPFNYFIKRYFLWPLGIKMHNLEPTEEWKESSHG